MCSGEGGCDGSSQVLCSLPRNTDMLMRAARGRLGNQADGLCDWGDFLRESRAPGPRGREHPCPSSGESCQIRAREPAGTDLTFSVFLFLRDLCAPTWASSLASASQSRGRFHPTPRGKLCRSPELSRLPSVPSRGILSLGWERSCSPRG